MKKQTKRMFALVGVLALGLTAVRAQSDGALLDALVKKGVLSDQEAEDIRASEAKEYGTTAAAKLSLPDYVKNIKLYGDARYRWEYLDETPQLTNGGAGAGARSSTYSHDNVVERSRYRLRVGVDYTFTDNFSGGFELETGNAEDSANQSFGNGFGKFGINVGLVYLQYKPTDWMTLVGGKQRNPIYTTDLVWDPDINPEGGAELFNFHIPLDNNSDQSFSIGLTAAQFIYSDNQEYNAPGTAITGTGTVVSPGSVQTSNLTGYADNHDVWMFVEQVPVQFNFDKNTYIKEVPGFMSYMNGGSTGLPSGFTNGSAGSTAWTGGGTLSFYGPNIADDLQIFTAPGEFDWKVGDVPFKVYWDFALNTEGNARVQDVYFGKGNPNVYSGALNSKAAINAATLAQNQDLGDNIAWLAGLQVGQNKKKGDWSVRGDFRQVGLGSIDPNINDSDWGDSFLNQQGIRIQSIYNFTDFLTGSLTYYNTWNYKEHLLDGSTAGQNPGSLPLTGASATSGPPPTSTGYAVTGATTSISGLVGANTTQRLQVDLQWKF
ncbi:MAG: putative porin [Methylacidiphilales bacterium]|nr:putative porin [Candidatus Methylacidiphilales bacterium]